MLVSVMTIDWNAPIAGAYCERTEPGFWGEPLNAGSSLLVVVLSLLALIYVVRTRSISPGLITLMALAVAIGIGSFLWHTFATRWAELADVLPIWGFVALFGGALLRKSLRPPFALPLATVAGVLVFVAGLGLSMRDTQMVGDTVSGSTQYLPAIFVVLATGRMVWKKRHPSLRLITLSTALFVLSFIFRSLDLPLCSVVPTGTHFLWHVTNCLAFGVLLTALVRYPLPEPGPTS